MTTLARSIGRIRGRSAVVAIAIGLCTAAAPASEGGSFGNDTISLDWQQDGHLSQMRVVDLSWSVNEGLVRFFSQAVKPGGVMTELFFRTFGLKLIPEAPYTLAARLGLSRAQEKAREELEPLTLEDGEVA